MKRRFFSGSTLDKAVLRAASHYGIDPSEVSYTTREKQGMLRARRSVVIEVDPDSPRIAEGAADGRVQEGGVAAAPTATVPAETGQASEPEVEADADGPSETEDSAVHESRDEGPEARVETVADEEPTSYGRAATSEEEPTSPDESVHVDETAARDKPSASPGPADGHRRAPAPDDRESGIVGLPEVPRPPSERHPPATGTTAFAVEKALRLALDFIELEAEIAVRQGEGRLEVELTGPDSERLLANEGRLLLTLQHLVPRMVRGFIGESVSCRVDCDNFHLIREETLRDMAQRAANEVRRRGRPWTLNAMPPEERRIIHITLVDDPAVKTESVGDGFFKRVRIRPSQ